MATKRDTTTTNGAERTQPRPYAEVKAAKRAQEAERQHASDIEHGLVDAPAEVSAEQEE